MKTTNSLSKVRSVAICFLTLLVFIAGFYLLSNATFRSKDSYLTLLDKGLFLSESSNKDERPFAVSKIIEFNAPFQTEASDLLNLNTLAFTSRNPEVDNSVQTGIYDLSKNAISTKFDEENQVMGNSHISVSNNGKRMMSSYQNKQDGSSKIFIYDVVTNKKINTYNGIFMADWLPDNVRFVGTDDYLFIQDTQSGRRENVLKLSDVVGAVPLDFLELKIMKDGQTVGIMYNTIGVIHVVKVDLNTKDYVKQSIDGQFFYANSVDNNTLVVEAQINKQTALYRYDITDNSMELLMDITNQKLFNITVSEDGKYLAYSVMNARTGDTGAEIHAVYLDSNQIRSNEVIYHDLTHFIDELIWTKDNKMLYAIQRNTDGTTILRILFKDP